MNENPVLKGFLFASSEIGGGGGLTGGGSSLEYSDVTPSQLITSDPRFFTTDAEDFYLNNNIETFNDTVNIDFEPPIFDNKPQISQKADRLSKHLRNSEINYINKLFHKNNNKKKKTLMDLRLGEIMENTSEFFNNFLRDYRHKVYDTEVIIKKESDEGFFQSLEIYIIAFVRYINENDNIIYLGIILIFISIILYFFNITSNITIVKNE